MATDGRTEGGHHRDPAVHGSEPQADLDDLRALAAMRWPSRGDCRRSLAGRAAGDDPGARPLLGDRVRLAQAARRG